jgi:hypothetical protein
MNNTHVQHTNWVIQIQTTILRHLKACADSSSYDLWTWLRGNQAQF